MSGLLYPHCRVDIYAVFELRKREDADALGTEILQDVEVLAVEYRTGQPDGTIAEENQPGRSNAVRVTFAVTPDQVKALELSLRKGDICLALRNEKDKGIREPSSTYYVDGSFAGARPETSPPSDPSPDDGDEERPVESSQNNTTPVEVLRGRTRTFESVPNLDPDRVTEKGLSR